MVASFEMVLASHLRMKDFSSRPSTPPPFGGVAQDEGTKGLGYNP